MARWYWGTAETLHREQGKGVPTKTETLKHKLPPPSGCKMLTTGFTASYRWGYDGAAGSAPHNQRNSTAELGPSGLAPWWWRTPSGPYDSVHTPLTFCKTANKKKKGILHICVKTPKKIWSFFLNLTPYLFISADAGGAAEVELNFFHRERLAGAGAAVAVESAAFAAVHGQLPHLTPP